MVFVDLQEKMNMHKLTYLMLIMLSSGMVSAQNIRKIAAYDNQSSYTSGVYCISDTAVYRYSWYYQEWMYIPGNGLTRINDTTRISAIAVYNNKISNSSGLFVFSDSVVLNYNWYAQTWFTLGNTGLPRNIDNKPDVYDLAVYGDSGSSSNSELFALTHSGIYRYIWYYQEWYQLENTGLEVSAGNGIPETLVANVYPNPAESHSQIELSLPENYKGQVEFAFFDLNGKLIMKDAIEGGKSKIIYDIPLNQIPGGIYYCEIKAGSVLKTVKMVRI